MPVDALTSGVTMVGGGAFKEVTNIKRSLEDQTLAPTGLLSKAKEMPGMLCGGMVGHGM